MAIVVDRDVKHHSNKQFDDQDVSFDDVLELF